MAESAAQGRRRRERVGVHGGDEDGVGCGIGRRSFAEGPGAESGPQAGIDELSLNDRSVKGRQFFGGAGGEFHLLLSLQGDDHRFEMTAGAAVDLDNRPGAGRGIVNSGGFFVAEKQLAEFHPVADGDGQGRLHAHEVVADDGHAGDPFAFMNDLFRFTGDGQSQPFFYPDRLHNLLFTSTVVPGPPPDLSPDPSSTGVHASSTTATCRAFPRNPTGTRRLRTGWAS